MYSAGCPLLGPTGGARWENPHLSPGGGPPRISWEAPGESGIGRWVGGRGYGAAGVREIPCVRVGQGRTRRTRRGGQ